MINYSLKGVGNTPRMGHAMSRRPRRNHLPQFKAKVAFAAIKDDHTLAELSTQFDVHANQILDWKNQLLTQSAQVFEFIPSKPEPKVDLKALRAMSSTAAKVVKHCKLIF